MSRAPETSDGVTRPEDAISLFAIGSAVLRNRRRIVRSALVGAVLLGVPVLFLNRTWTANASFALQGTDPNQASLRSLAGQLGVPIPGASGSLPQSPDFYAELLESRAILGPIVEDTVTVLEEGGPPRRILDLLKSKGSDSASRREKAILDLRKKVDESSSRITGVVKFQVKTQWPSVSYAITNRLLTGINKFNLKARQDQAAEERRFVEGRLAAQREALTAAETRLSTFLRTNRQFSNSPELTFEHDRLQRDVALQQQLYVSLSQSYEETRIREVRDVAVVSVIESPSIPTRADGRGTVVAAALGLFLGALFGLTWGLSREAFARRRAVGDAEADGFAAVAAEARGDLMALLGRARQRTG